MADDPQAKPKEAPPAPPAQQDVPADPKYTREVWKEHARVRFDLSPHALHGALHDAKPGQLFTEAEVRSRLGVLDEPIA